MRLLLNADSVSTSAETVIERNQKLRLIYAASSVTEMLLTAKCYLVRYSSPFEHATQGRWSEVLQPFCMMFFFRGTLSYGVSQKVPLISRHEPCLM